MRELPPESLLRTLHSDRPAEAPYTVYGFTRDQVLAIQKQAYEDGLRDADLREAYENACKLVADMHQAAIGDIAGPVLGVVEDVKALRNDADRYRWMRDIANAYELRPICNMIPSEWDGAIDCAMLTASQKEAP